MFPEAIVQAMVRLGHPNIPDSASCDALLEHFDARHISTSSVRWSDDDMWRWHTRLLHSLDGDALLPLIQPHLPEASPEILKSFAMLVVGNLERIEDVQNYIRLLDVEAPLSEAALQVVQSAGSDFYQQAQSAWNELEAKSWKAWMEAVKARTGCKGKGLFLPLRVALSGALHGPEMSSMVAWLSDDAIEARLVNAERLAQS